MADIDEYIVLLERHHQAHLENPRPVRGTFRGIEDLSCTICSPITEDGGLNFYRFWNWYQRQTTAYQYTQITVRTFNRLLYATEEHEQRIQAYVIIRSCRYDRLRTTFQLLENAIVHVLDETQGFYYYPNYEINSSNIIENLDTNNDDDDAHDEDSI